jgi:hypothetical protein
MPDGEHFMLLKSQVLMCVIVMGCMLFFLFGTTAYAKGFAQCTLTLNTPARLWISFVTSSPHTRYFILFLSLSIISVTLYLIRRFWSHPLLLPALAAINCLLISFVTFMVLTIMSHRIQFIGSMGMHPYWPYFGR